MDSDTNENERSDSMSDDLSELLLRRDELNDMKARQEVVVAKLSEIKIEVDDSISSVVGLYDSVVEKMSRMNEEVKDLESIENMGKWLCDNMHADIIKEKQNTIRLQEETLIMRINQFNDAQKALSEMENDTKQQEKEKLDLKDSINATEAEHKQQQAILEELSSRTILKEIAERETECRLLENEYFKLENALYSESLELQLLFEKNNIILEQMIPQQEAEYRNQLSKLEPMNVISNDYKPKYQQKTEKIMLEVGSIEKQREDVIDEVNLKINHNQVMYAKLQSDYDELINKMSSEFGDTSIESVEQMILEAKAKLAKLDIDCQTIDSRFETECRKIVETEKRELMLLRKQADLKQKFDKQAFKRSLKPTIQNENPSYASNRLNDVRIEHHFAQPVGVPKRNTRKLRKVPSRRQQQAPIIARNNTDSSASSSESSQSTLSPNDIARSFIKDLEKRAPEKIVAYSSVSQMSTNAGSEIPDALRNERRFKSWRSLHLFLENM